MSLAIMRRAQLVLLGAGLALAAPLVAVPAAKAAETTAVTIDNFTFSPQRLVVKAGTSVTWTNHDDIPHTVAASGKEFKSKVLDTDDAFTFTFTAAGSYEYYCSLHPHMTGTIVVEAAPRPLPSP